MRESREVCRNADGKCTRCETIPPASGQTYSFGQHCCKEEWLLLAPLDSNAADAIDGALQAAGFHIEKQGLVRMIAGVDDGGAMKAAHLYERLKGIVPRGLQERVKAVFAPKPETMEEMLSAIIQAETMAALFEEADVEWARTVLATDRLFSVYHPILNASDGSLFAYEALIRAHHPCHDEIVGAGRLIYACERLKLQHALDQRSRVAAIRGAAQHGLSQQHLFVNFLPSAIYDPDVCLRTTMQAVEECGLQMNRLVFEVIETEQIPDISRLRKITGYYRKQGAGIALDDISSGYASLQYLADLLPDYVKIDRDLVESAAEKDSARYTLQSIVDLAKKLDVKVVAEGIETQAQMQVCLNAGVDYLQGFLFAHPAAPPETISSAPFRALAQAA